ncbi:MAG: RDD family protein [Victivallales bacterium]|nr:RDD family protein [Victivallales bacterium]
MNFIVKDQEGNESASLSHNEVEQLIIHGKLNAESPIRNAIIKKWNTVEGIGMFAEILAYAEQKLAQEDPEQAEKIQEERQIKKQKKQDGAYGTAFRNRIDPVPASLALRLSSALTDLLIFVVIAGILALAGWGELLLFSRQDTATEVPKPVKANVNQVSAAAPAATPTEAKGEPSATTDTAKGEPSAKTDTAKVPKKDFTFKPGINRDNAVKSPSNLDNKARGFNFGSRWTMKSGETYCCISASDTRGQWIKAARISALLHRGYIIISLVAVLYFSLAFGVFAQTVGMWFWGLFVAKTDGGEAYMFRGFVYAMLMLAFGILMPLMAVMRSRAIHDRLAGVTIFRTAGARER